MATIKAYTDIEQSKKLAKILPIESSDMYYLTDITFGGKCRLLQKDDFACEDSLSNLPCWSLAALLGILPQSITKYIESEMCTKTFHLNLFRSYYYCCSYSFIPSISDDDGNNTLYCIGRDNWVDACVDMVKKLHELNLL